MTAETFCGDGIWSRTGSSLNHQNWIRGTHRHVGSAMMTPQIVALNVKHSASIHERGSDVTIKLSSNVAACPSHRLICSSCYRSDSQTTEGPFVRGDSESTVTRRHGEPSYRKLVFSVMLGEDLAALRPAALALLALAFRLSWFPLTAASRRDFR